MPYLFDTLKLKIGKEKDRRIKLNDSQKEQIRSLYGEISQRKLAKMFNVSRRLIIFIGDEEKYKRNKELRKLKGKKYYIKDRHKRYMKSHRLYKKLLFGTGEQVKNTLKKP